MKMTTLEELAVFLGATIIGDPKKTVCGVSTLAEAKEGDLSFFSDEKYRASLATTSAVCLILSKHDSSIPKHFHCLVHPKPSEAIQQVVEKFCSLPKKTGFKGIHPTACIHPSAKLAEGVEVGPYVVIDEGVTIGKNTKIFSHVSIGPNVSIGSACCLYSHVSLREEVCLGDRVILQPGAVLGSCGYGYHQTKEGTHKKIEHIGNVIVEDDVEIGANTTIDRGRFCATRIGAGTKIDNQVQIGHNVRVGRHCLFVAQVGIAGSAELGNYVVLGGKVGVNGHIRIGDQVMVGACSAVSKSLEQPGQYIGLPAEDAKKYFKLLALQRMLANKLPQLKKLLPHIK